MTINYMSVTALLLLKSVLAVEAHLAALIPMSNLMMGALLGVMLDLFIIRLLTKLLLLERQPLKGFI